MDEFFHELRLPRKRLDLLVRFGITLAEASKEVNLTRILAPRDMAVRHFLDSYHLLPLLKGIQGPVVDIGTGGGIPGIPLAIFRRDLKLVLIDGTGKKIRFVNRAIEALEVKNVEALHIRAEEYFRGKPCGAALSRAALPPDRLFEILARKGASPVDRLLFMEGAAGLDKIRDLLPLAKDAGFRFDTALPYHLPGLDKTRHILCFRRA